VCTVELDKALRDVGARIDNFQLTNYELPTIFQDAITQTDVALQEISKVLFGMSHTHTHAHTHTLTRTHTRTRTRPHTHTHTQTEIQSAVINKDTVIKASLKTAEIIGMCVLCV